MFVLLAAGQTLTPFWVELGPNGEAIVRVVIEDTAQCPVLTADEQPLPTKRREPVPEAFKPACEAIIPAHTRSLKWQNTMLPLPRTPKRVAVLGDTGCRVKGKKIQDCDDLNKWPLQAVAAEIAKAKPDLIVHVGDYVYRESACPDAAQGCSGPHGDNWPAWNADFFAPAVRALSAAPWAFARGNHEDCKRSWRGWFYYLDPRRYTNQETCTDYSAGYIAVSGTTHFGMLDSAATKEDEKDPKQISFYAEQLLKFSGHTDWIIDHHPFWAYKRDDEASNEVVISQPLEAAWDQVKPQGVQLVLSGHIHLFEFLSFDGKRPNQLVAGDGGTDLAASVHKNLSGEDASGIAVKAGKSVHDFGFTLLQANRSGWTLQLKDSQGKRLVECKLPASQAAVCQAAH